MRPAGFLCLAILLGFGRAAGELPETSPDKKSGDVFKNLKILNDKPSDLLLPSMQFMTSSLGVHCQYCHVENAFDKDDKKPKQTARRMMQMVEEINSTQFHTQQAVTCYSCHRGSPKPLTIPAIAESPSRLLNEPVPHVPSDSPSQPSPGDVIAKYIAARGGAGAIASLSSLEKRGTFRSDSREFPMELYEAKSGRQATVIHFSGSDRITESDGSSGWTTIPGRPPRAMTPGEVDAARVDADLQFGLTPIRIFKEVKFTGIAKVGTEDTVVLSGRRPDLPSVEMYFGANNGLLLRIVHYSQSPLGLNPIQTDYSDYRAVLGTKIPFRWVSSTPTGRYSVQIKSARANVAIPKEMLSKPTARTEDSGN